MQKCVAQESTGPAMGKDAPIALARVDCGELKNQGLAMGAHFDPDLKNNEREFTASCSRAIRFACYRR